ncbi:MAG: PAS domain-containing protein, partial [Synergistaceae bacterium]|nr:PAS domain-containing protein [Synergistaceae bacterium]
MRRRIFFAMTLLSALVLAVSAAAYCFVFYRQFSAAARDELGARAEMFRSLDSDAALSNISASALSDVRITVVESDGTVLYDNTAGSGLENHSGRAEIKDALSSGTGESARFSDTLGKMTYYHAVRTADGSVVRLSKTIDSVWGLFSGALPAVFGIACVVAAMSYAAAGFLTRRIVEPINTADLDGALTSPYDELAPFVRKIGEHRERIASQMLDLRNRSDTIEAIMENMKEGIMIVDGRGTVLSANRSASSIFSRGLEGSSILEITRDMALVRGVRGALAGERGEAAFEQGGRTYRVFFSPVTNLGAITLLLDVTENTRSERMRREFSANVSHELKTPITSIYGNAELLAGGMVKEGDREGFYGKIKEEAARMTALIDDIIMISRLDEGYGRDEFEDVSLMSGAKEAAEALSDTASEYGVSVAVLGDEAVVRANRAQIYELFCNLIDNAVKYNRRGGSVEVRITSQGDAAAVTVSDTGIGIPPDETERVFERFYRVDKSRSKKTGGTGLGLAIVKHIATVHDAHVTLASRVGEGT